MPQAFNFSGIPDVKTAPPPSASGYNFDGIQAEPTFKAHAEIPTADQLAAAQTPADRVRILSQTPVGQDLDTIKNFVKLWADHGPHAVVEGIKNFIAGNYTKGAHQVITGAGITALPMVAGPLASAAVAAPVATGLAVAGTVGVGYAGQQIAEKSASALGATPDQATLAGDVGAFAGGVGGSKIGEAFNSARLSWAATRRTAQGAQSSLQLRQAVPPTKSAPYTTDQFQRAMPYFDLEHGQTPITSVQGLREAADNAVSGIEAHIEGLVQVNPTDTIRTNPIAAVKARLSQSVRGDAMSQGLKELSDLNLDQPITVVDAERIRKQLNAENTAILRKNSYDVATARAADPGFAAREAAVQSLRDGIYQQLEDRGVQGVRQLRQDEGAVIAMRRAIERQIFAGDKAVPRSAPISLPRQLAATGLRLTPTPAVIADPVARLLVPKNLTRDALVEKAFQSRVPGAVPNVPMARGTVVSGSEPVPPVAGGPAPVTPPAGSMGPATNAGLPPAPAPTLPAYREPITPAPADPTPPPETATSYRGHHTAPDATNGAPLNDLTGGGRIYPDDVYGPKGQQFYGTRTAGLDTPAFKVIQAAKGKPNAYVTVYRAVPSGTQQKLLPGDWVTISKSYAMNHGTAWLNGDYDIIATKVKASDIYTNGDSILEWGFHPNNAKQP